MYTFTYQKALLHTYMLLVFKIIESLQCIFKQICMLSKFDLHFGAEIH